MSLRKKLAVVAVAAAVVLAFPVGAFAADNSPVLEKQATSTVNGVTTVLNIKVKKSTETSTGGVKVDSTDVQAGNTVVLNMESVVGKFNVYTYGDLQPEDVDEVLATINVSSEYGNHAIKVFVEYYDGTTGYFEGATSSTGSYQLTIPKVGYITVVIGEYIGGGTGGNDSPVSPQTGYDFSMTLVAVVTLASLIGAVAVARSLRKDNDQ